MSRSKRESYVLCALTEWKQAEKRGRGDGTGQSRWILVLADRRNWMLAQERQGYPPTPKAYGGNLRCALSNPTHYTERPLSEITEIISKSLSALTEIPYDPKGKTPIEVLNEIDQVFGTNLLRGEINPKIAVLAGEPEEE